MIYTVEHEEVTQVFHRTLTKEEISFAVWNTNLDSFHNRSMGNLLKGIDTDVDFLLNTQLGSWELIDNKMIFYTIDGAVLTEYNLYDENNKPSLENVARRERIT
jgi:hypothetical protein